MFVSFRIFTIAAFIFLSYSAIPPSKATQLNYSHICLLVKNGESIATGNSCIQYYSCENGIATLQTCPGGLSFSKDTQSCVSSSLSNCGQAAVNPCNAKNVGKWAPVAGSCSDFYYCSAKGPQRGKCPTGENFNPQTQACDYASNYPCSIISNAGSTDNLNSDESEEETGVNLCTFMPNGVFFGSATSCADWNICTNNVMTSGTCPTGYYFNPNLGKCDFQQNVKCAQVTYDPNLSNSPSVGGACTTLNDIRAATQCNAYYICNGVNFVLNYCTSGNFFDTVTKTCVPRLNARNNCDRCVGTKLSFVNSYSTTGCTGYLYCQNGIEHSAGTCPTGSYFNENSGACVFGAQPKFGCCNPIYYESAPSVPEGPPGPPTTPTTTASTGSTTPATTSSATPAPAALKEPAPSS